MSTFSIARRYAKALLEAVGSKSEVVSGQLATLAQAISSSTELHDVMTNPQYSTAQRFAVVDALLGLVGNPDTNLKNMMHLLTERSRVVNVPQISRVFRDLVDAQLGRVRGTLTAARALSSDQVVAFESSLKKLTARDVVLESAVDKSLIGGVKAQVGSMVYDGSVRNQLDEMRRTLT